MRAKNKIYSLVPSDRATFKLSECYYYIPTGTKKTNGIPAVIAYSRDNEPYMMLGPNNEFERTLKCEKTTYRIEKVHELPDRLAELVIKKGEVENLESHIEWLFPQVTENLNKGD